MSNNEHDFIEVKEKYRRESNAEKGINWNETHNAKREPNAKIKHKRVRGSKAENRKASKKTDEEEKREK